MSGHFSYSSSVIQEDMKDQLIFLFSMHHAKSDIGLAGSKIQIGLCTNIVTCQDFKNLEFITDIITLYIDKL